MNPPYLNNLHLQIIEKVLRHLEDDGNIVNLSPVRWLQDPLAEYKRNTDYKIFNSILLRIKNVEFLDSKNNGRIFIGAKITVPLGIYDILGKDNPNPYKYENTRSTQILFKILKNTSHFLPVENGWRKNGTSVFLFGMGGKPEVGMLNEMTIKRNFDVIHNGLCIDNGLTPDENRVRIQIDYKCKNGVQSTGCGKWKSVGFNTISEGRHFIQSTLGVVYRFIVHQITLSRTTNFHFVPYMGYEINPRTGLKGYESEWTDEDLRLYYGLSLDDMDYMMGTLNNAFPGWKNN